MGIFQNKEKTATRQQSCSNFRFWLEGVNSKKIEKCDTILPSHGL